MKTKVFELVERYIEENGFKKPNDFSDTSDFKEIEEFDSLDLTDLFIFIEDGININFSDSVSYTKINSAENISLYLESLSEQGS